jgi:hypothetical protein
MFLVLAFLVLLFQNAFTAKVPICRSLEYSLKTTAKDNTPKEDESPPTFYSYNFNMDVTVSPDFPEFPNKITIYNFTEFSLDDSLYFRASPPQFFIDKGFQYNSTTSPSTMTGPWIYYSPNGEVTTAIEYYHQKISFGNITDQMGIYLNKGRFYKIGGYVMNPETDKCMTSTGDRDNVSYSYTACCNKFDYVKIPDKFEDPCLEYETNGRISYQFEEVNVKFNVHYTVTFDGQLKMEINIEDAPKVAYQYFLKFNEDKICEGSQKVHARTCIYKLPFFQEDFEMDIRFAFFTDAQSPIMTTIGGLNRRNGIWLKAGNSPFTPKKPCSYHNSTLPFIYATSEASFCCSKFKNPTTTSTTTTTTTTPAPEAKKIITTNTPAKLEAKSSGSNTFSYVMTFMFLAACTAGVIFGIHKYYHRRPGPQYTTMGPDL